MASWNQNPIWTLIDLINNGNQIEPSDGFLASDMVKVIENLQYLYNNKIDKSNSANKIYGTDDNGDQIVYNRDDLGTAVNNIIPSIMSEQPLGFRRLVGQSRKTIDDTRKTSIYTIASENAAIVPDRIPWYRAPGNPDNIAEQPTATLPVSDPVWKFDAVNKRYADSKVDNDTDRIRCGDLYVAGAMGLIQAKQIQNPSRGNGVTVNDKLKVLIAPVENDDVLRLNEFSVLTQEQVDLLF